MVAEEPATNRVTVMNDSPKKFKKKPSRISVTAMAM
jgi:hypothetical protein